MKQSPPNGVIGPRIEANPSIPKRCRIANKYKEPLKKSTPKEKFQPAIVKVFVFNLSEINTTAINAKA